MTTAEIITIGTELLLGEIQDTNTQFLARQLREMGINLFRATTLGDNVERVAVAMREAVSRADIVITSGGLGPTVDDPTRDAVSRAFEKPLIFDQKAWKKINARYVKLRRVPTENNKRQAFFPSGSIIVNNPVGTAPAFIFDSGSSVLICLPGVPGELEYLFKRKITPFLKSRFQLNTKVHVYVLHTSGIGESVVDEKIGDLEKLTNPTVGLLAHSGQVDIRIAAKAGSRREAKALMSPIIKSIKDCLPTDVFGVNEESLVGVVSKRMLQNQKSLRILEYGVDEELLKVFYEMNWVRKPLLHVDHPCSTKQLRKTLSEVPVEEKTIDLAISIDDSKNTTALNLAIRLDNNIDAFERLYSGPFRTRWKWAENVILDFLRRNLS